MKDGKPLIIGGIVVTDEMMAAYAQHARRRAAAQAQAIEERRTRALELARQAAALLRSEFGASRVALFGSLAGAAPYYLASDIDLAVWDLPEREYLRAVGRLIDLDTEIDFDLVRIEEARPSLLEVIARDGVPL